MNNEKKQRGSANYFRALAGVYLLYLTYQLAKGIIAGEAEPLWLMIAGSLLFAVSGAGLLWMEWKAYKYAKDHKDDPSSWSDDEDAALPESADGAADKNGDEA